MGTRQQATYDLTVKIPLKYFEIMAENIVEILLDDDSVKVSKRDVLSRESFQRAARAWIQDRMEYFAKDLDITDFGYERGDYAYEKEFAAEIKVAEAKVKAELAEERKRAAEEAAQRPARVHLMVPREQLKTVLKDLKKFKAKVDGELR